MDTYTSISSSLERTAYKLLGVTCMNLSIKMEESFLVPLQTLSTLCQNVFSPALIASCEEALCVELDWNLNPVTVENWVSNVTWLWNDFVGRRRWAEQVRGVLGGGQEVDEMKFHTFVEGGRKVEQGEVDQEVLREAYLNGNHLAPLRNMKLLTKCVDTIVCDDNFHHHLPQAIVILIMFCVLCKQLAIFTPSEIRNFEFEELDFKEQEATHADQTPTEPRTPLRVEEEEEVEFNLVEVYEARLQRISQQEALSTLVEGFISQVLGLDYNSLATTLQFVCPYVGGVLLATQNSQSGTDGQFDLSALESTANHKCVGLTEGTWENIQKLSDFVESQQRQRDLGNNDSH